MILESREVRIIHYHNTTDLPERLRYQDRTCIESGNVLTEVCVEAAWGKRGQAPGIVRQRDEIWNKAEEERNVGSHCIQKESTSN